jgi:hypothetical protein
MPGRAAFDCRDKILFDAVELPCQPPNGSPDSGAHTTLARSMESVLFRGKHTHQLATPSDQGVKSSACGVG